MEEVQLLSSQLKLHVFPDSIGSKENEGMVTSLATEMENRRGHCQMLPSLQGPFQPLGDVGVWPLFWRFASDIWSSKSQDLAAIDMTLVVVN